MIEEFSFGNFRSFKEIQTLNMSTAKIKSKNKNLDVKNIIKINKNTSVLKSKAIYGANASGKSNVIKALIVFLKIIQNSVKEEKILNLINSFQLSTETENKPTFFQIIFRIEGIKYRYGFETDHNSIKSEWLFATPNLREQILFIRENNSIIEINKKYFEDGIMYQKIFQNSKDQLFTNTSLFITHLASTGFGNISKKVVKSLTSIPIVYGLGNSEMFKYAGDSLDDTDKKNYILSFLKNADVGIDDIITKEFPIKDLENNSEHILNALFSIKKKYNSNLKFDSNIEFLFSHQESEGTIKMFELSPFIYKSLKDGTPLIIDEFDARFHPLITKKIIELYNSIENKYAQLIFVTHDTNLLSSEILRRDQIDFVEKDKYGASHLYSLVEIKGVRSDASFEKDYIQGKYGAIPFLGDFENLISFE